MRSEILDQGARHRGALLLAAGKLRRTPVQHRGYAHHFGHLSDAAADLVTAEARHPQRRGNIVENRHVRIVDELLVDHRHVALLHLYAGHVAAIEPDLAAGRFFQPGHDLHQSGLACKRRSQQHVETAGFKHEAGGMDMSVRPNLLACIFKFERHGPRVPACVWKIEPVILSVMRWPGKSLPGHWFRKRLDLAMVASHVGSPYCCQRLTISS